VGDEAVYEFSEASKANVEESFSYNPTKALYDIAEYSGHFDGEDETVLTKDDVDARKETEFYAQFINVPEEGLSEYEYQRLYRDVRAKRVRDDKYARAPDTYSQAGKQLLLSLGVGIFDPINAASGYLPGLLAKTGIMGTQLSRKALVYERQLQNMDLGKRVVSRAGVGAGGGALESVATDYALVNPALRMRQEEEQSLMTSLIMGGAIGSAARVTFGAVYDLPTRESRAEMKALKAEWKERANLYIQQVDARKTPEHARTIRELARVIRETEKLSRVDEASAGRSTLSYGDQHTLTQSAIGLFLDDRVIDLKEMESVMHEKNLQSKYNVDDVDRVRADVVSEVIEAERGLVDTTPVPETDKRFGKKIVKLESELKELQETLRQTGPANKRKKLHKSIADKKGELEGARAGHKIGGKAKRVVQKRVRDARKGELDPVMQRKVDMEVNRRMEIINAKDTPKGPLVMNKTKLKHGIDNASRMGAMYRAATSEESKRSYVKGAKEELDSKGVPQNASAETADMLQQAVDAEANARQMAEEQGVEYNPENIDATIKAIDDQQKANEIFSTCMSKAA